MIGTNLEARIQVPAALDGVKVIKSEYRNSKFETMSKQQFSKLKTKKGSPFR
jgi:hypothetical protein